MSVFAPWRRFEKSRTVKPTVFVILHSVVIVRIEFFSLLKVHFFLETYIADH